MPACYSTLLCARVWSVLWHVFRRRGDVRGAYCICACNCLIHMLGWNCLHFIYMLCKSEQVLQLSTGFLSISLFIAVVFLKSACHLSVALSIKHPFYSPLSHFPFWLEKGRDSLIEKDCKREGDGDHGQRWCDRESKEMWMLWDKAAGIYGRETGRQIGK